MPPCVADVLTNDLSKPLFVGRELPNREGVDVDDADLLVGLDDPIPDDAIVTVRAPSRVGAPRLAVLGDTAARGQAHQQEATNETMKQHDGLAAPCQL